MIDSRYSGGVLRSGVVGLTWLSVSEGIDEKSELNGTHREDGSSS